MKDISLYIHIPFCKNKCMYCDFPSFAGKEKLRDRYISALKKEIYEKSSMYRIKTIFIGGGTPSFLTEDELDDLLSLIEKLEKRDGVEFTVECNPGTLTKEKLTVMKKRGVNRLSIGLQSTNNSILRSLGRIHDFETFKENFNMARSVGFNNINVDIMFGLPDQSVEVFKNTLKDVVSLNPEHISSYSLIIEEGTPFYKMYEDDKLNLPSEEEERDMYRMCVEYLGTNGYHQYEISNFSKEGYECRHNKVYWEFEEYIGCGSASSSFVDDTRYRNEEDIEKYIDLVENNEKTYTEVIKNSYYDDMEEFMFMGLRMNRGILESDFENKFNKKIDDIYKDIVIKHIEEGLLKRDDGRLYLTSKGIELSNYVMSDFIIDR